PAGRLLHRLPADRPAPRGDHPGRARPAATGPAQRLLQDRQAALRRHLLRRRGHRHGPGRRHRGAGAHRARRRGRHPRPGHRHRGAAHRRRLGRADRRPGRRHAGRRGHPAGRPPGLGPLPHRDARAVAAALPRTDPALRGPGGGPVSSLAERPVNPVAGPAVSHESADLDVTGEPLYTDDLVGRTHGVLHAWPLQAPHAHARVTALRTEPAYAVEGVVKVLTAADVPGVNDAGIHHDEPLCPGEVQYYGHAVCWVLGETLEAARLGAEAVEVEYEPLPALLSLSEAIEAGSFQGAQPTVSRGDAAGALQRAPRRFTGEFEFG